MKKFFFILATAAAITSCGTGASTETPSTDSTSVKCDSTKCDSTKCDTLKVAADTTKK
jgi:hypothetical protein